LIDGRSVYSTHMGNDEPAYDANNPLLRSGQPVEESAYLTDALTREAVDFIDRRKSKPFFLYLAYNAVHSPLQGADEYMRRFDHIDDIHRRIFAAMLSNLDDSVGAVLDKLRQLNLEEDTLIFFISDNGGPTRELTSSNLPLRGGKGEVYEGGIRVPFLCQWKGTLPAAKVYDAPVTTLDVFATAAAVARTSVDRRRTFDGVDLMPFLLGQRQTRPHEVLYWRMGAKGAIRIGDWKLVRNGRNESAPWELYDLTADQSESANLAASQPEKFAQLRAEWERHTREMAAEAAN